ncbi:hypothetical protein BKA61DRAFT_607139 [Leptodontidium sp. MPI-SDFR-AT-0119]|nr:hypothetical protein BKA61DRAFT_607139 [Leptodontidium sp. MPI-SDFR-AT-0119]
MTTTFFEPMQPAYHSATGRVHLNFSLQPEEQIHIVLLADIYGFSTHIQVTKLGRQQLKPRPYTGLSSSQNKALMDHCNDEPYPSHSSYLKLSQRLDIPREQTVKWFQRARARNRQSLQIPPFGPVIKEINSTKQPKQKQSGSAELRSPYMLRAKHPRVMLGQSPPKVESGRIGSASEKSVDGEDTILVNHPASTVGMTLVEENNRFVRRSTRAGGN